VCVGRRPSTYDQDVVELVHAVDLGQQLVDHGVVDPRAAGHAAALLADCVDLVKYDDVKAAVCAKLWEGEGRRREGGGVKGYWGNWKYEPSAIDALRYQCTR